MNVAAPATDSPRGSQLQTTTIPTDAMGGGSAFPDQPFQGVPPAGANAPPPTANRAEHEGLPHGDPPPYWQQYRGPPPCWRGGMGRHHGRGGGGRGRGHPFGHHPAPPFGGRGYGAPHHGPEQAHPPSDQPGSAPETAHGGDMEHQPSPPPHSPDHTPPHELGHSGPPSHGFPSHGPGHHKHHHGPPHHGPGHHGRHHHGHGRRGPPHHGPGHHALPPHHGPGHHHGPGPHGPPGHWTGHHPSHRWGPPPPPPPQFPLFPFPGMMFFAPDHDCPVCNTGGSAENQGGAVKTDADGMEEDGSGSSEASEEADMHKLYNVLAGASLQPPEGPSNHHPFPPPAFAAPYPPMFGFFPPPDEGAGCDCTSRGQADGPTSSSFRSARSDESKKGGADQEGSSSESVKRMRQASPPRGMES